MRALKYLVEEAVASLWRGRRSGILSVITIAAALFVLGGLLLVTWNVENVVAGWTAAAEMSVYLRDDVTPQGRDEIDRLLESSDVVAERAYVSKADALVRFRRDFTDLGDLVGGLSDNPLPASFEVRLVPVARSATGVEALAARLAETSGVADVRYDQRWIERVTAAVALTRGIGAVVVTILILAAALTVTNVVRLACHARRDEIEIMQLVGAPMMYVRGPFVMEGILQGGAGAVIALGLLWIGFLIGRVQYGQLATDVLGVSALTFLPMALSVLLVLGGMAVGCIGGLVAAASTGERLPAH